MSENEEKPSTKTRKKRRVPGTDTAPDISFIVRLPPKLLQDVNDLCKIKGISRNKFMLSVTEEAVRHFQAFRSLWVDPAHTEGEGKGARFDIDGEIKRLLQEGNKDNQS